MFEFITQRRIARKAVDWHHSALDEIITGAICGGMVAKRRRRSIQNEGWCWKSREEDLERRYRVTIFQARESFQLTYAMKLRNERQNDQALLRDVLYRDFFGPREPRRIAWRAQSKRARRFLLWDKVVYGLILIRRGWYHGRPHAFPLISIMGQLKAVNESGVVNRWWMRAPTFANRSLLSLFYLPRNATDWWHTGGHVTDTIYRILTVLLLFIRAHTNRVNRGIEKS